MPAPPVPASLSCFPVLVLSSPSVNTSLLVQNKFPSTLPLTSFLAPIAASLSLSPSYPLRTLSSKVTTLSSIELLLLTPLDLPSLNSYKEPTVSTSDSMLFEAAVRPTATSMSSEITALLSDIEENIAAPLSDPPASPPLSPSITSPRVALASTNAPTKMFHYLSNLQTRYSHSLITTPLAMLLMMTTSDNLNGDPRPPSAPDAPIDYTSLAHNISALIHQSVTTPCAWHALPAAYHTGQMDPSGLRRHYLVLHDCTDQPCIDERMLVKMIKNSHPHTPVTVMNINTRKPEEGAHPDIWRTSDIRPSDSQDSAWGPHALGTMDILSLRTFLSSFATSDVLPVLERRMASLNTIVSNSKKGLKNMVKSLWRKPKELEDTQKPSPIKRATQDPSHPSAPAVWYSHSTPESATLLLASSLILSRDYASALTTLKLVREDYKADKSNVHLGHVQYLLAWCCLMLSDPTKAGLYLINAIDCFTSILPTADSSKIAPVLSHTSLKLHNRLPSIAARLSATATLLYLQAIPLTPLLPLLDRLSTWESCGMCGSMYELLGNRVGGHTKAVCYAIAAHYYSGMPDDTDRDINTIRAAALGMAECLTSGLRWDDIFGFFVTKLVKHLPKESSLSSLLCDQIKDRQYAGVSKDDARKIFERILARPGTEVDALRVDMASVFVKLPAVTSTMLNPVIQASRQITDLLDWDRFVTLYQKEVDERSIAVRHHSKTQKATGNVGEPIQITFNAANDLFDSSELERVELIATLGGFSNDSDTPVDLLDPPQLLPHRAVDGFTAPTQVKDTSVAVGFLVEAAKTVKLPKRSSSTKVTLRILPLAPGPMTVLGFRFFLRGRMCTSLFDIPGRLLNDKRENKARHARGEANEALGFEVVGNRPKIEVEVCPSGLLKLNANDVGEVSIRFHNVGEVASKAVAMWASIPNLYFPSDDGSASETVDNMIGCSGQLHHVAERIEPGQTLEKKAYVFARSAGTSVINCQVLWNEKFSSTFAVHVEAAPALSIDWSVSPSYENSAEYVGVIDVASGNPALTPKLTQVGAWSRRLELGDTIDSFEVGQRGVAHFVVKSMEEGQGASSEAAVVFSCATGAAGCSNVARNFVVMEKTNSLMKRKIEEHKEKKRREEEEGGGVVKSIQEIRRDANLAKSKLDGTFNVGEQKDKVGSIASVLNRMECGADMYVMYEYAASTAVVSFVGKSVVVRPSADSAIQGCPLLVTADYKSKVAFGSEEEVVEVELRNRFFGPGGDVEFIFEVGSIPGVEINGPQQFRSSLGAGERMVVKLKALYLGPGVYNLQNIRITVANGDRNVPFLFPFHWIVAVS